MTRNTFLFERNDMVLLPQQEAMDIENLQRGAMGVADILRLGLIDLSLTKTGQILDFKYQHISFNYIEIWLQHSMKRFKSKDSIPLFTISE